jgi:lactate permease
MIAGSSFAASQFLVSKVWGPFVTDIVAAIVSIAALTAYLRLKQSTPAFKRSVAPPQAHPAPERLSFSAGFTAWLPWACLCIVMLLWSYFRLFQRGQFPIPIATLHNAVLITLYQKPYAALYSFQPLAGGTAVLVASIITAICFRTSPSQFLEAGIKALKQLAKPGITVLMIVGLAYLFNYSGMAYTIGAAVAGVGSTFPILSSYLGWIACFLSGSDTSSNLLFGNLQVAAAHHLHLSEVLLAATNSSGAVTGKMISPQNIAVGVTTVGLIGREGDVLHRTFWHSVFFAGLLGILAFAQAYWISGMVP